MLVLVVVYIWFYVCACLCGGAVCVILYTYYVIECMHSCGCSCMVVCVDMLCVCGVFDCISSCVCSLCFLWSSVCGYVVCVWERVYDCVSTYECAWFYKCRQCVVCVVMWLCVSVWLIVCVCVCSAYVAVWCQLTCLFSSRLCRHREAASGSYKAMTGITQNPWPLGLGDFVSYGEHYFCMGRKLSQIFGELNCPAVGSDPLTNLCTSPAPRPWAEAYPWSPEATCELTSCSGQWHARSDGCHSQMAALLWTLKTQ